MKALRIEEYVDYDWGTCALMRTCGPQSFLVWLLNVHHLRLKASCPCLLPCLLFEHKFVIIEHRLPPFEGGSLMHIVEHWLSPFEGESP